MVLEMLSYHLEQIIDVKDVIDGMMDYPDGGLSMSLNVVSLDSCTAFKDHLSVHLPYVFNTT